LTEVEWNGFHEQSIRYGNLIKGNRIMKDVDTAPLEEDLPRPIDDNEEEGRS
jgi:hypothetical protein